MRNIFACLLTIVAQPLGAAPLPFESQARIAYLVDASSGVVLLDKDSNKRIPTASMAKMMTAYVAFEAIKSKRIDPAQQFTVNATTWQLWNNRGSSMFLKANERVSAEDLLHGILTLSGNDASVVLAEGMSGGEKAFADEMNKAALNLKMADSNFATANGWPDGGATYSSARDLTALALEIINSHPELFKAYFGQRSFRWNNITQPNRNPLLGVVEGADGMKTGHSDEAGYCLVGTAERNGRRLVMVIAGLPSMEARVSEARALMQWGFDNWKDVPLYEPGQGVATLPTQMGASPELRAIAPRKLSMLIAKGSSAKPKLSVRYKGPIKAPVKKGAEIAQLIVHYPDGMKREFPLVAANDLAEANFFERAWNGLRGLWAA
jgi:serine-type D-Ala-D-Ala carboxypeptidase (penicillin-binding protein 5/6)